MARTRLGPGILDGLILFAPPGGRGAANAVWTPGPRSALADGRRDAAGGHADLLEVGAGRAAARASVWLLLTLASACTFNGTGLGEEEGGLPPVTTVPGTTGDAGASTGPGGPTTSGGMSMSGTSGALDPTTGGETTTGPGPMTGPDPTTGDGATTGPDPTVPDPPPDLPPPDPNCLGPLPPLLVLVEDAEIEFPMIEEMSGSGEGRIASSGVIELGNVEFAFNVPCADDYMVWARVYDGYKGEQQFEPDSFYAKVSGGDDFTWRYGCQSASDTESWTWKRVRQMTGDGCDETVEWTLPLAPGTHSIRLRNREGQTGNGVRAAVARVLLTNDPNLVPTFQ
jgi:hypothetical protein